MNHTFRPAEQRGRTPAPHVDLRSHKRLECPDLVALIGFNYKAVILSGFVSSFSDDFAKALKSLPDAIDHSTNITAGLRAANDLLALAPQGLRKRIWGLSDGEDNLEVDGIGAEVARAAANRTNINTIGFGDPGKDFNPARLQAISAGTRTGKYVPVETAQRLGQVLKEDMASRVHQGEATVFCIDLSPSMRSSMGTKSKIEVVRDTMFDLIRYKQQMWS